MSGFLDISRSMGLGTCCKNDQSSVFIVFTFVGILVSLRSSLCTIFVSMTSKCVFSLKGMFSNVFSPITILQDTSKVRKKCH